MSPAFYFTTAVRHFFPTTKLIFISSQTSLHLCLMAFWTPCWFANGPCRPTSKLYVIYIIQFLIGLIVTRWCWPW